MMSLNPSVAETESCGISCAVLHRRKWKEKVARESGRFCRNCQAVITREPNAKDKAEYCGKRCWVELAGRIRTEVSAIRRIGAKQRSKAKKTYDTKVKPELLALKRIGDRVRASTIQCAGCDTQHIKRYPFSRHCSESCRTQHREKTREAYRASEAYRKTSRAAKSRRRARMRTTQAESIDPFDVFDRDKWRCHLCGVKTVKALRGTAEPLAPELEHIIPLSKGGTHTWGNVACSCRKCNHAKGDEIIGQIGMVFS